MYPSWKSMHDYCMVLLRGGIHKLIHLARGEMIETLRNIQVRLALRVYYPPVINHYRLRDEKVNMVDLCRRLLSVAPSRELGEITRPTCNYLSWRFSLKRHPLTQTGSPRRKKKSCRELEGIFYTFLVNVCSRTQARIKLHWSTSLFLRIYSKQGLYCI